MPSADQKQQFDVLFSTLCEFQSGLLTSTTQVAGFLSVAIGWLATSTNARDFLRESGTGRNIAVLALIGTFLLYAFGSIKVYRSSQKTFRFLTRLDFMPSEYFQNRVVDVPILLVYCAGNLFLVGLVIGLVYQISGTKLH
jgi:uncharacterized membrane protein (UPF0136 family)